VVKIVFIFLSLFSILGADEGIENTLLNAKIKTFLGSRAYNQNSKFINIIFSPESNFYTQDRIDDVKVIETLIENGLLNLFFKKPQELRLNFKTSGSPLLFVKIMGDSLRNIGYYRYVTIESNLNSSSFTWSISLTSEYATDPLILQKELRKSGCSIINIEKKAPTQWTYTVDMRDGFLNIKKLKDSVEIKLKRSLHAHWLNISQINKIVIKSSRRNSWYPYIAYYDSSLHLLKVIKKDSKTKNISLDIPRYAKYIKISDLYTLKNIKDALVLNPIGYR